ncbi:hypothetical protein [Streptomyces inhibens]|uniref:hypothetical protein n=1 Tax=Streptomyces inhibens TaxID=2293571 RepID=UPI001EE6BA7C|nr:hypothetical protein [Streptomyces inhibens]UKY49614.1 hypothetical protein KI385_12925 [Streptomyces inhibens]
MAKDKKQNRSQQQKASAAERGQQEAQKSSMEAQAKSAATGSPSDLARKNRERRFGHN